MFTRPFSQCIIEQCQKLTTWPCQTWLAQEILLLSVINFDKLKTRKRNNGEWYLADAGPVVWPGPIYFLLLFRLSADRAIKFIGRGRSGERPSGISGPNVEVIFRFTSGIKFLLTITLDRVMPRITLVRYAYKTKIWQYYRDKFITRRACFVHSYDKIEKILTTDHFIYEGVFPVTKADSRFAFKTTAGRIFSKVSGYGGIWISRTRKRKSFINLSAEPPRLFGSPIVLWSGSLPYMEGLVFLSGSPSVSRPFSLLLRATCRFYFSFLFALCPFLFCCASSATRPFSLFPSRSSVIFHKTVRSPPPPYFIYHFSRYPLATARSTTSRSVFCIFQQFRISYAN